MHVVELSAEAIYYIPCGCSCICLVFVQVIKILAEYGSLSIQCLETDNELL